MRTLTEKVALLCWQEIYVFSDEGSGWFWEFVQHYEEFRKLRTNGPFDSRESAIENAEEFCNAKEP